MDDLISWIVHACHIAFLTKLAGHVCSYGGLADFLFQLQNSVQRRNDKAVAHLGVLDVWSMQVLSTYGHIRDIPSKPGSVDPTAGFEMSWELLPQAKGHVAAIVRAVEEAQYLVLATDPDREGEAISWHVVKELQRRKLRAAQLHVERITFTEVTRTAILDALKSPRQISPWLVHAYLARRVLDYLVGFTLSPLLWRKLPGARSAGRVQSVALRLVCEREADIRSFQPVEFWTAEVQLMTRSGLPLRATLARLDGKKLGKFDLKDGAAAEAAADLIRSSVFRAGCVESKVTKRNPSAPFITSTLQTDAANKLGFGTTRTMQLAQKLYEGVGSGERDLAGLITYMRTDGVQMSKDAIATIRKVVKTEFGGDYIPASPRVYKTKAKNAQEAHEAIRPTDPRRRASSLPLSINHDMKALYDLIWKRAVASQMSSAGIRQVGLDVNSTDGTITLRGTGSKVEFPGFRAVYGNGTSDESLAAVAAIQSITEGEEITVVAVDTIQHFTMPPGRYTEGALVQELEAQGIGRPSTYAAILKVLKVMAAV
ncbi:unnamed protein product [Ostreobium quekettii]|uniref:DNA topoisomerase n=1 Tax=Ostreobium quekettii TaxID=121088 RepID=A0A8S1IUB7_9CHLO|nr:unnamed protein product [Ostreobium quekettii]